MPRRHWTAEQFASTLGAGLIGVSAIPGIQGTRVQNVLEELAAKAGANPASDTALGAVKTSVAPVDPANPIAVENSDPRNTNQRVPTDGSVTDVKVAAAHKDGTAATPSMRTLGTGAQQAVAGNDLRLSDARTPTAHKATHAAGGVDVLTPSDIQAIGEVYDEGALIAYAQALDFLGAGVLLSRNATTGRIEVTISGAAAGAASETAAGIAEIATQAEANAGTDDARFVTPLKLATRSGKLKSYAASGQSLALNTDTKINFTTPIINKFGTYDTTTHRWTPPYAGEFMFGALILGTGTTDGTNLGVRVYKNGTLLDHIGSAHAGSTRLLVANGNVPVIATPTDYFEVYATYFAAAGASALAVNTVSYLMVTA